MHATMKVPKPVGRPPGFKGTVNREIDYSCSRCGVQPGKENLLAKRVQFTTIGKSVKVVRSRVRVWLCGLCCVADPDWMAEKLSGPGFDDVKHD